MSSPVAGLVLLGELLNVEAVHYGAQHEKAGQVVPGLSRVVVAVGTDWQGQQMTRQLTFNATDRDTGEPSRVSRALLDCNIGDSVAVHVAAKPPRREGGKYAELDAWHLTRLDGPVFSVSADAEAA